MSHAAAAPAIHRPASIAVQLSAYLAAVAAKPQAFNWALFNCCTFAAGWVQHATGRNVLAGLPGTPSPRAALALVKQLGGSLATAWSQQLGAQPIAPFTAQVGDVVLLRLDGMPSPLGYAPGSEWAGRHSTAGTGQAVGVCAGRTVVAIDAQGACHHLPLSFALAAWRLPAPQQPQGLPA